MGDPGIAFCALALRLDRVQPGLIDSWWGPAELAARISAEPVHDPRRLADDAAVLLRELPGHELDDGRRTHLHARTTALRALALRLSGERHSWSESVEAAFSVQPELSGTGRYVAAHEALDQVLPGRAPLAERYRAYRATMLCPQHKVTDVLRSLTSALRARVAEQYDVPAGDAVEWSLTSDAPWAASARHLGGGRTRIILEAGTPVRLAQLPGLVAHEAYPGHHTQSLRADATRVRRGWVEHAVTLVATPDCLIAEGAAEHALSIAVGDEPWQRFAAGVYSGLGLAFDPGLAAAVAAAVSPLEDVRLDAAMLLHQQSRPEPEVRAYLARWGLLTPARVDATMAFLTHPLWRHYVATYSEGGRLVAAWLAARPESCSVAERYRRLLDEPLLPSDLAEELLLGVHPEVGRVAAAPAGGAS